MEKEYITIAPGEQYQLAVRDDIPFKRFECFQIIDTLAENGILKRDKNNKNNILVYQSHSIQDVARFLAADKSRQEDWCRALDIPYQNFTLTECENLVKINKTA